MEKASGEQRRLLQELLKSEDTDPETKVRRVISIYDELNVRNITEIQAYDYINKAFGFLQKVAVVDERKKEITDLAASLIGRNY